MATQVGNIVVRVGADVGPLKRGLGKGSGHMRRFEKRGALMAKRMKVIARTLGVAGLAIGGALVAGARKSATALDALGKKARQIGTTAETLQEMQFAATSAGVSLAGLDSSLERFVKRLGEADQGIGAAKKQLELMGLEARDLIDMPLADRYAAG